MFAVIETGGKQYKVEKGLQLEIEKLADEAGKDIEFDKVLLTAEGTDVKIGKPYLEGVKVTAKIVEQKKGIKLITIKKKAKKRYERKIGHRQLLTLVEITGISA